MWLDMSGQGDSALSNGANRPTYVASDPGINNMPCLDFDGSQQLRIENYIGNSNEGMTFVALFQVSTPSSDVDVIHQHGGRNTFGYRGPSVSNASRIMNYVGGSLHVGTSTTPANTWVMLATTFDTTGGSGTGMLFRNDSLHANYFYTPEFRRDTSFIGGPGQGGGTRLNGRVAELVKYNRVLHPLERRMISNAYNARYGIAILPGTDFYSGDETAKGNYDLDVIGVGMDTIGGSTYHVYSAGFSGGISVTRSAGFETGDHVLIGHSGTPSGTNTVDIVADTVLEGRWQRDWYIDVTDAGTAATVDLAWDFGEVGSDLLPDSVQNYMLLYRANRTGAWTVAGVADAIVDDQVHFNDVALSADGYYTMGSLRLSASPLPVELFHFSAQAVGPRIRLDWATASETNNRFFDIQRSRDAQSWTLLGRVDGAGTSTQTTAYRYWDQAPMPGLNYYRLRQEDLNGNHSFSEVVSAWTAKDPLAVRVWPVPAQTQLHVAWTGETPWSGQLVQPDGHRPMVPVRKEAHSLHFDLSALPRGIYILHLQSGHAVQTRRILVGP